MVNRSASHIIKGYLYQFDKTILEILNSTDDKVIIIEDVEDVDIESAAGREAIQCKYLPSKTYSLAHIRDAILPMLNNMLDRKGNNPKPLHYHLYAYFSNIPPQTISLNLQELKACLMKNKRDGAVINYQKELKATDADLRAFLKNFCIEIAEDYDAHKNKVFDLIKATYNCAAPEEVGLYYNNALTAVSLAAADTKLKNRKTTKCQFLTKTKTKQILYSIWRLQEIGKANYCREIRRQHFSIRNIPAYARIFIIELEGNERRTAIKEAILELRKKWSSHERRRKQDKERYAPYVLLQGIQAELFASLKSEFLDEGIQFIDGFSFEGATFNVNELNKLQTRDNQLSLRFINNDKLIPEIIASLKRQTKEIYQFYRTKPIVITDDIKNIQIKIEDVTYVKEII